MPHAYGYLRRTLARDGDQVDVFLGPHLDSDVVFGVDQVDPRTGRYDETKWFLGWKSKEAAKAAYLANYTPGWQGFLAITAMTFQQFRRWLEHGDQTKPIHGQVTEKYARPAGSAVSPRGPGGEPWTDEDERKHPRDKGRFASKPGAGKEDEGKGMRDQGSDAHPSSLIAHRSSLSLGGRAFEIVKQGKEWLFRLNQKAPWSRATPAAAAAIEKKVSNQTEYHQAVGNYRQAAWGQVPESRRLVKQITAKVNGIVARILQSMEEGAGSGEHEAAAREAQEAAWRNALNRKWNPMLAQARTAYREAVRSRKTARRMADQMASQLKVRRTPKYLQEVEDPDTGELLPRHALDARRKEARQKAREELRQQQEAWRTERQAQRSDEQRQRSRQRAADKIAVRKGKEAFKTEGMPLTQDERDRLAGLGFGEQMQVLYSIRQERAAAEKATQVEQQRKTEEARAKLQADAEQRAAEQRQADEAKQQEGQRREQQQAEGEKAIAAMASEFGTTADELRKRADEARPAFGTSTGANLTLPDWHDPRVLQRVRAGPESGRESGNAEEVRTRLDREEREAAENEQARNAAWVSSHGKEYPSKVWDAAQKQLDAGHALEVSDGKDVWTIEPGDRENLRRGYDGNLQVHRRGKWIELGDTGLETIARSARMVHDREAGDEDEGELVGAAAGGADWTAPWEEFRRRKAVQHYAAGERAWREAEHPRDTAGEFAEKGKTKHAPPPTAADGKPATVEPDKKYRLKIRLNGALAYQFRNLLDWERDARREGKPYSKEQFAADVELLGGAADVARDASNFDRLYDALRQKYEERLDFPAEFDWEADLEAHLQHYWADEAQALDDLWSKYDEWKQQRRQRRPPRPKT